MTTYVLRHNCYTNKFWHSYWFSIDPVRLNMFLHIAAVGEKFVAHLTHVFGVGNLQNIRYFKFVPVIVS